MVALWVAWRVHVLADLRGLKRVGLMAATWDPLGLSSAGM